MTPKDSLPMVLPQTAFLPTDTAGGAERLLAAFLSGRSAQTIRAYGRDLADFAAFKGVPAIGAAAVQLLAAGQGGANEVALRYRAHLLERGLAPATVNRRMAALRSLVQLARTLGMIAWELEVPGVRAEAYRDTRGPGREGFRKLLDASAVRADAKGARDTAILRLLHDLGLRRAEVCRLDVGDIDLATGTLSVLGKGRMEKERLTLPAPTREALVAWLVHRGASTPDVPLFTSLDRARKGSGRLTGQAVYHIVRGLGNVAGIRVRPHGVRHLAITTALDTTNGDVRKVQAFSRHRNVQTLLRYDDARQDLAGDVAARVAAEAR
jgi:integrase/recombinase XerC